MNDAVFLYAERVNPGAQSSSPNHCSVKRGLAIRMPFADCHTDNSRNYSIRTRIFTNTWTPGLFQKHLLALNTESCNCSSWSQYSYTGFTATMSNNKQDSKCREHTEERLQTPTDAYAQIHVNLTVGFCRSALGSNLMPCIKRKMEGFADSVRNQRNYKYQQLSENVLSL